MSFAASAAFIGPTLYVYYYSSANTAATFGSLFAFASAPNSTNTLLIANQTITSQGPSPVSAPSGAWMFSNSNKQLLLFLSQSSQKIITLLPQSTPEPLVAPVFWNNTNINNVNWSFTDQSSAPNLFPTGVPPLWIASGNSGSSEGSALYEIFMSNLATGGSTTGVNKLDISNMATLTISQSTSVAKIAGNIDPSSSPRVVRLPGSVVSNVNVVAVGKCISGSGTCMSFFIDSSPSAITLQPQANPAYDPTSCIIATNSLIVMVTKTGIWTLNYTISSGDLQTATWSSASKSVLPNAPLSCSVSGTQLFVVLQGGSQPTIVVAQMTGTWAWQTQTVTTPSVIPSPTSAPTGSSGDSGGAPGSGGSNGTGTNGSTGSNGSLSNGTSTGLGKPVIIAIAVVAVVLLILIPALFIWWCRRKRQNGKEREQRTEEFKKSIVLEHGGGKRMGMSMPLGRVIPPVPPRHSPLTFLLETPGTTPALGRMSLGGNDHDSSSGSFSVPGSSTMSYDEKFPNYQSQQPSMHSLPHPYQQPSRTWSQDGGGSGGSPSPRTLNQFHQHSFSDNDSTAGPGSVDGYQIDSRVARGGIFDDKHEIMDELDNGDVFGHHDRSTTSMSFLKSPAMTDLEPPMPLMSPMYSSPGLQYLTPTSDSPLTTNSTLSGAPVIQNATKPKRIRIEDMVSPGLINAQLILQQSQKPPQKPSNLR